MNRELWEFNEAGTAEMENDANDFFYEWVSLEAGGLSLKEILERFIDVSYSSKKIRVKARNGAIFIVVEGDKDDTPNPIQ